MVFVIMFGRRVPHSWFTRARTKLRQVLAFQEHMWLIINQSMQQIKKKVAKVDFLDMTIEKYKDEKEDLNYNIQWLKCTFRGTPEAEQEEYEEAMGLYRELGKYMKKDLEVKNEGLGAMFRTAALPMDKMKTAYEAGYKELDQESTAIAVKLREMGILISIQEPIPEKDFIKDPRRID